jgi:CheY-like chemotaxis protein
LGFDTREKPCTQRAKPDEYSRDHNRTSRTNPDSEAVQLFRTRRPDVTLTDIQMPGVDGIETLILKSRLCCLEGVYPV